MLEALLCTAELFGNRTVLQVGLRPRRPPSPRSRRSSLRPPTGARRSRSPRSRTSAACGAASSGPTACRAPSAGGLAAGVNEFLQADVVLAVGSTLPRALGCLGLRSLREVVGLLRHLASVAALVEWVEPPRAPSGVGAAPGDGTGAVDICDMPVDVRERYNREELVAALMATFENVHVVGNSDHGTYFLGAGARRPEDGGWARVRVRDMQIPDVPLVSEDGQRGSARELARSGFLWGGETFTKRVVAERGEVAKLTSSLLALREALFLDLFAPDFRCVPRLIGHWHRPGQLIDQRTGAGTPASGWLSSVAMELVEGQGFEEHLAGLATEGSVRDVLEAALELLECLGAREVEHGDLWAPNLLVARPPSGGRARLVAIDFGAARLRPRGGLQERFAAVAVVVVRLSMEQQPARLDPYVVQVPPGLVHPRGEDAAVALATGPPMASAQACVGSPEFLHRGLSGELTEEPQVPVTEFAAQVRARAGVVGTISGTIFADLFGRSSVGMTRSILGWVSTMASGSGAIVFSTAREHLGNYDSIIRPLAGAVLILAVFMLHMGNPKRQPARPGPTKGVDVELFGVIGKPAALDDEEASREAAK
ncbi:unnamed protein product [Prorocentrum cordatum]|uniref:Protein kinase domain-containing protein n=1 Tax=Prorocentrum cordatum TaxID=2364126 RepID=A0ABN9YCN0_9DINO|nr:unnamed protein product [Polarella glacialis]